MSVNVLYQTAARATGGRDLGIEIDGAIEIAEKIDV